MEVRVLGSSGGVDAEHGLVSFLINDKLAIDAGSLAHALTFEEQGHVTDVVISHIHLDHIVGLPFFLANAYEQRTTPVRVFATETTLGLLKKYIFNGVSWPDFTSLPTVKNPTVEFEALKVSKFQTIAGLQVMPVSVNHSPGTTAFIVEENGKACIFSGDTGITDELWDTVNNLRDPRMLFLECSFPNGMQALAQESKHLTPDAVESELQKIDRPLPTRLYHLKPTAFNEIQKEISAIDHPDLAVVRQGTIYKL